VSPHGRYDRALINLVEALVRSDERSPVGRVARARPLQRPLIRVGPVLCLRARNLIVRLGPPPRARISGNPGVAAIALGLVAAVRAARRNHFRSARRLFLRSGLLDNSHTGALRLRKAASAMILCGARQAEFTAPDFPLAKPSGTEKSARGLPAVPEAAAESLRGALLRI
jgi:hypothetical protein